MRPTGKSYRALLRAIEAASNGARVYLVGGRPASAHREMQRAAHLLAPVEDVLRWSLAQKSVTFETSGGSIVFTNIKDFVEDTRTGRLDGYRKPELKFVFDDCSTPQEAAPLLARGAEVI